MKNSPTRILPTLLTLVTVVLAGLTSASVQRLMELDQKIAEPPSIAAPQSIAGNGLDLETAQKRLDDFAGKLRVLAEARTLAGEKTTWLGTAFFAGLGLLVLSLIAAERNARNLLRLTRLARADADRTRAQLVEAVENINEGFVLYDNDDRLVLCNRKFREAYRIVSDLLKPGVTSEEILRAATQRGQFPQAGDKIDEWVANRMAQRRRFDPPFEQQLSGGRWHMVSDRPTRDGGLVGVRTDITELKRREIELREARQNLEQQAERMRALAEETQLARAVLQDAIESINEGFCLYDSNDALIMCNSRFLDLHDRARGGIAPGASFADITRAAIESGHLIVNDAVGAAIAGRDNLRRNLEDSSLEEQFDNDRWVRVSTRRMRNGGFVSVYADITEMKQREFALTAAQTRLERQTREMAELADVAQRANRAKSEFLAVMSHEIRTPLNGVISALALVGDSSPAAGDRNLISIARSGAHSLLTILNDILDMSKIEAGMLSLNIGDFQPRELVDEIVALSRVQADAKGLGFFASVSPDVPDLVSGDAGRLRQMALNYATNAIKFTDSGRVELHVSRAHGSPDSARFEVVDTGIGIPFDKQGHVFRDFVQLDQSIRRRHGGTGLGLAITRRLARLMGGNVGFTSEPDHGSTFWFEITLPAASVPQIVKSDEPAAREAREIAAISTLAPRILLAEDNDTNRYLARTILERMGCVVVDVCNGAEAVEACLRGEHDLVLMDISMPVMDGLEATRRVRAAGRELPIVALSANTGPEFEDQCRAAGMNGCLAKPIDMAALRQRLAALAEDQTSDIPIAQPQTAGAPLNENALGQVYRDIGPEAFQRVVAGCRHDIGTELAALLDAWSALPETRGSPAMRNAAHKLVSLTATIGAEELSRLSSRVEKGDVAEIDRDAYEKLARATLDWLAAASEKIVASGAKPRAA